MDDLRERRLRAGLTQEALAARSGVAQPNIASYETGRRRPSATTQRKLTAALQILPRDSLRIHRDEIVRILAIHKMSNPRIFGSAATRTDTVFSDLDLLVDAEPELDLLDVVDAADELEELLGVPVDLVTSRSLRPGHGIEASAVTL